jgi:hypothetical protein
VPLELIGEVGINRELGGENASIEANAIARRAPFPRANELTGGGNEVQGFQHEVTPSDCPEDESRLSDGGRPTSATMGAVLAFAFLGLIVIGLVSPH